MTSLVSARGVSKHFGEVRAVDNVNFEIEKGKILGLIGPNGAGKTTLLKAVLGLTDCEGDLSVLGLDPFKQRKKLMQNICFIADVAVLPRWIKVSQLLDYVQAIHPNFSRSRADELLKQTKVRPGAKVKELSKGVLRESPQRLFRRGADYPDHDPPGGRDRESLDRHHVHQRWQDSARLANGGFGR